MKIKVTRDLLDHYRKLKQEIPVLELELQMMKNTDTGLGNSVILTAEPAILDRRALSDLTRRNTIAGRKFWNARKRRSRLWISGLMTSRMDRQDACFGCSTSRG